MFNKYKKLYNSGTKNLINREKWLLTTLQKIKPGSKILDAGAGELKYKQFCIHLNYTSQDFAQYDGIGNSVGLQTKTWDNSKVDIISDITTIPVDNNSFDAIMCIEVFEHIPYPITAVGEFSRILKKDGLLILTVPFSAMTHFAPYFFNTGFSKYWHERILKENGFEILDLNYNGNYFEHLAQEVRRLYSISTNYSKCGFLLKKTIRFLEIFMLVILTYLSKHNKNSEELLCYGINILAKKI